VAYFGLVPVFAGSDTEAMASDVAASI
jgi:hypothetical protein